MSHNVKWMPAAQSDLEDIYQFYFSKSERVAVDVWNRILESATTLNTFAFVGPLEPLLADREKEYRSLVVEKYYKLVYYVEGYNISIAAVWDVRRNPERLVDGVK